MSSKPQQTRTGRTRRRRAAAGRAEKEVPATHRSAEESPASLEAWPEQMTRLAKWCGELESNLKQHAAPELETILKLHRLLILQLSAAAQESPLLLRLVVDLMKPVMEWARLEERRQAREEEKKREQMSGQNSDRDRALTPETLAKIERELCLF